MKKLLCVCLALVLALSCACALAEEDLQAQLDAANAKIEELEELVEMYEPYYRAQIAVTYGENGVIYVDDVMEIYNETDAMYETYYGITLESMGVETVAKQQMTEDLLQQAICRENAVALGLIDLGDEAMAAYEEEAKTSFEETLQMYAEYMSSEEEVTEETLESTREYLAEMGMTEETLLEDNIAYDVDEAVYQYAIKDVAITEEDVQATYEELVANAETDYADDYTYYSDLSAGNTIVWNPEGYRYITHVLIQFDDDQTTKLDELNAQLDSLAAEKDAIENPTEEETESDEEVVVRTVEEIDADIEACNAEIEALYQEIIPEAQQVIDEFNEGTSFEDLIAAYNEDPGMEEGSVFAETGYPVCAGSTTWVTEFTDAAMAIEQIGQISGVVRTDYGVHVLYYAGDIPAGEVGLEEVREYVEQTALVEKQEAAYNDLIASWVEAAAPVYYYENLGIEVEEEAAE